MSNYTKATNFATKDTLPTGDSNKIVKGTEIDNEFNAISGAISSKADIASPTFTGTPAAPTATAGSNTTQLANTAFVTAAVTDTVTSTTTFINKTLNLTSNTLVGTIAQFNTALSDDNFATIAGTETLTNKTLTSPTISAANLTGVPVAPTASAGTSTTQVATTAFVTAALQAVYPVGSVYINASSATNPGTLLGFGTWTAFGAGRVMVGLDAGDALFDTAEETGGSKDSVVVSHTHTATVTDPGHNHTYNYDATALVRAGSNGDTPYTRTTQNTGTSVTGISVANSTTGVSGTNANVQPYITVRMWKRTA
jgi:hypothetical protein